MSTTKKADIQAVGTHAISIERDFDAPVAKVFRAMTEPELIARWIGPEGLTTVVVTNDARHGGTWTLVQRDAAGNEHSFRGVFHGEQTPELSHRTFEWLGMPGHVSYESLRMEDLGDGRTHVVNTSVFLSTEDRDGMFGSGMDVGVNEGYARLDAVLAEL